MPRTIFHWRDRDKIDLPTITKPLRLIRVGKDREHEPLFVLKYYKRIQDGWKLPGIIGSVSYTKARLETLGAINLSHAKRRNNK